MSGRAARVELMRGTLVVSTVYACSRCCREGRGDNIEIKFEHAVPELEKMRFGNGAMPVGWASFYAGAVGEYRCPGCLRAGGDA